MPDEMRSHDPDAGCYRDASELVFAEGVYGVDFGMRPISPPPCLPDTLYVHLVKTRALAQKGLGNDTTSTANDAEILAKAVERLVDFLVLSTPKEILTRPVA